MTPRMLRFLKNDGIDLEKTEKACRKIFEILEAQDFNLKETHFLLSSMNGILKNMTRSDPLRKVGGFDYSSSIKEVFSLDAASNTASYDEFKSYLEKWSRSKRDSFSE